jgi:hypothetical protein
MMPAPLYNVVYSFAMAALGLWFVHALNQITCIIQLRAVRKSSIGIPWHKPTHPYFNDAVLC